MKAKSKPRAKRPEVAARANEETSHRPFAVLRSRAKKAAESTRGTSGEPPKTPSETTKEARPAPRPASELSFAQQMQDVRPLAGRTAKRAEASAPTAAPAPATETRFEVLDDGTSLEGRRLDVDPREVGKLRRAQYPIDGTLDLHGKTLLDAKAAVVEFIARRRRQGDRALRIVHGKGVHSSRGQAVLRGELGAWLSQGTAAKHVLAFVSWLDDDEKSGSLAVLLAKHGA